MSRTKIHNLECIETAKQQVYEIRAILVVLKASQGKYYTGTTEYGNSSYQPQVDIRRITDLMPRNYMWIPKDKRVDHIRNYNEHLIKLIADENPYSLVENSLQNYPLYYLKLFTKCVEQTINRVLKDIKDGRWM